MRRILLSTLLSAGLVASMALPSSGQSATRTIVFGGEGNRLNAYDAETGAKQTVIPSAADDPAGGRDINAQICFDPSDDPSSGVRHFIAGEDTGQVTQGEERAGQGWGWFELRGDSIGGLTWTQVGKFEPTYATDSDNPENYGCGFLSDGRLLTTDVGDQFPQDPATGQLIVWFPPFDRPVIPYCKIDTAIPTAGQVYVDEQDRVYVGAQRSDTRDPRSPAGIYRYSDTWPTGPDAAGGCGRTDATDAPLVDDGAISREVFIPAGPLLATPTGVVRSPSGGFYASSVFDGRITEYDANGQPIRPILQPNGQEQPPYPSTGTPLGLGIGPDGTLYYADIGVEVSFGPNGFSAGPGNQNGSVRQIRFVDGAPQPPEKMDDGLAFPDGIGVLNIDLTQPAPTPTPTPTPAVQADAGALPATGGGLTAVAAAALAAAVGLRRRES